jgi:hypothetical protein
VTPFGVAVKYQHFGSPWFVLPMASFCEHGNKPSCSIKKARHCLTSGVTMNFSKNILHHGVTQLVIHQAMF